MKKSPSSYPLTELEGNALALVKKLGPCTPYAVRSIFENSPADFWSGSAGTIYPLIRRLEKRGIISASDDQTGRRKRKLYTITRAGDAALKAWLHDVKAGASIGFDPMRTRLHYAELYTPDDLNAYAQAVVKHMMDEIPAPQSDDPKIVEVHDVWLKSRKAAIEKIVTILNSDRA